MVFEKLCNSLANAWISSGCAAMADAYAKPVLRPMASSLRDSLKRNEDFVGISQNAIGCPNWVSARIGPFQEMQQFRWDGCRLARPILRRRGKKQELNEEIDCTKKDCNDIYHCCDERGHVVFASIFRSKLKCASVVDGQI